MVRPTDRPITHRIQEISYPALASIILFSGAIAPRALATPPPLAEPHTAAATPGPSKQHHGSEQRPTVPPLPTDIPTAIDPDENGIVGLIPQPDDDLGIGHLRPAELDSLAGNNWRSSPLLNARWLRGTAIPIYAAPEGDPWGWLVNGWLLSDGHDPLAIGRDAAFSMVQVNRGLYTFPVLELREDGWFQFQYTPAGSAWAHVSHLNLGSNPLVVEAWEDYLPAVDRIEFRRLGVSQPVRSAPSASASLQALVGPNSLIEPLDVEDDWLRVRVVQPANGCTPLPGSGSAEGWVRWRDDTETPLVWVAVDDCL